MDQNQKHREEISVAVSYLLKKAKKAGYSVFLLAGDKDSHLEAASGSLQDIGFHLYKFLKEHDKEVLEGFSQVIDVVKLRVNLGNLPTDGEIEELFKLDNDD